MTRPEGAELPGAGSPLTVRPAEPADAPPTDWRGVDWSRHGRSLLVDGRRANLVDLGDGPPVIFVHGLSGSWQNWLENLLPLAHDHRVIAVDLPGFGCSEMPEARVTISSWARWLDRLCDRLEIEAATFVGNSMGGFICADLAIQMPWRVERLALVTAAGLTVEHQRRERVLRLLEVGENLLQVLLARGFASSQALARRPRGRRALMWVVAAHPERLSAELVCEQLHGVGPPGFVPALDVLTSYPIRERLAEISASTPIVWGERDRLVPLRDAYEFERLIPRSRLVVYEDAGHVPMRECPERFNRDLREFIDGTGYETTPRETQRSPERGGTAPVAKLTDRRRNAIGLRTMTASSPEFDRPAPGVARFTVPLALASPDHLNCHVIEGAEGPLLVDCGTAGSEDAVAAGLTLAGAPRPDIVITHGHIDHWRCAPLAATVRAHPEVELSLRFARDGLGESGDLAAADLEAMERAFAA